ncbi:sodium:solute symporter family protein [candidate division KSB1 bacterium]|nr:sodium:solute symporter family protein [candidate division KSB1 bacterium]
MRNQLIQYGIIIAYFIFIVTKGIRRSKEINHSDDFLVAGRNIGWFFLLCTMGATVVGGGASIGAIGKTYEWGILMLVVSAGWYIHFIFSGLFVAPRFRKAELYTVAGYFGHRFGPKSRFLAFLLSLLFSVGVLGAQMVAFGKIITSMIPQMPYVWAVFIGGGLVILYSTAGGLLAVIHTDVYQFIILIAGFAITLMLCAPELIVQMDKIATKVPEEFFQIEGGKGWLFLISTFIAFLLGETFSPGYATRYCVAKNIKETRKGIVGAGVFLAFTFPIILFFIALYARFHFPDIEPEMALPKTILKLNNPFVGGLIIAALMSAVMSSADSILNSSTAIFVKDLYEEYLAKTNPDTKKGLLIARMSSISLGLMGILLAVLMPNVIDLLLLTYNLWAPGIILPVIYGVFSKRASQTTNNIIFITMLTSTLFTILYMNTGYQKIIQPSVFGVVVSGLIFLGLRLTLGKNSTSGKAWSEPTASD